MPELAAGQWAALAFAALVIGLSKTGLPGAAILAIPLLADVFPAKASTGIVLPMLIVADLFAVAYYRRKAVWSHLIHLIPWATGGIVIGHALMGRMTGIFLLRRIPQKGFTAAVEILAALAAIRLLWP